MPLGESEDHLVIVVTLKRVAVIYNGRVLGPPGCCGPAGWL